MDEIKDIDQQLEKAEHVLNWNSQGGLLYFGTCLTINIQINLNIIDVRNLKYIR